jgi:CHAD domain-containing protein
MDERPRLTAEELIRDFLAREVGNLLRADSRARHGEGPEGVHQVRVNARRLRSELRVVEPVMKRRSLKYLRDELRWIGDALGLPRDADILKGIFDSLPDNFFLVTEVIPCLTVRRLQERERVGLVLRSKRYRRLIASLREAALSPPLRPAAAQSAKALLLPRLRNDVRDLFSSADTLGASPSDKQLHRLRIKAKRSRYGFELADAVTFGAGNVAVELALVQSALGNLHDHAVALEFVRKVAASQIVRSSSATPSVHLIEAELTSRMDDFRIQWQAPFDRARVSVGTTFGANL